MFAKVYILSSVVTQAFLTEAEADAKAMSFTSADAEVNGGRGEDERSSSNMNTSLFFYCHMFHSRVITRLGIMSDSPQDGDAENLHAAPGGWDYENRQVLFRDFNDVSSPS
ncbi:hypothetical protein ACJJTC_014105 [Scirpophaga incertulas]